MDSNMDLSSLPNREKWLGDDCLIQLGGFWSFPQTVKPIKRVINHYNLLPSDVILVTVPKTGTTWLKSLLYSILNRSSKHKLVVEHPHELVPFLELQVFAEADESLVLVAPSNEPRLFATHIPYHLLTKTLDSSVCKVVYLTHNPKNTPVSLWHFVNKWNMEKLDQSLSLDEATCMFCRGVSPYGPYYDHVLGYRELSLKKPENVMFVTYEELLEDPNGYVQKLGDFLGCPFEEEGEVDEIVKNCSIEARHDAADSRRLRHPKARNAASLFYTATPALLPAARRHGDTNAATLLCSTAPQALVEQF
ncbi:hypothetical protein SASPL_131894 [Salvia splendens]|uniref:Sulfotransferase n=1 Tax=Salvia splendens TaxID=180675 RepID=A0A8X8ZLE4_SALSN|nr:hypothetical protein SASPL_131894 [Salvia splendens]